MQNVVGSGDLGREINLKTLSEDADPDNATVEYDTSKSHWLRVDFDEAVALLFNSGSYIIVGADTPEYLVDARDDFIAFLNDFDIVEMDVEDDFSIKNIVSTAMLNSEPPINLNALAIGLSLENVEYEPEQFPGLIYRPEDVGCVVIVYTSGKLVITGAKSKEQAEDAKEIMDEKIDELFSGI